MTSTRFPEPVVVWLDPDHTDFGVTLIENVPEGLSALHRFSLGETLQGPDAPLWQNAAGALVQADVEPTPGNIRLAWEAFLRLVKQVAPVPRPIRRRAAPRTLSERVGLLF